MPGWRISSASSVGIRISGRPIAQETRWRSTKPRQPRKRRRAPDQLAWTVLSPARRQPPACHSRRRCTPAKNWTKAARPEGNMASQIRLQARQKYRKARKISIGFSKLFLIGMFPKS
jgi:hypothetical protein